MDLSKSNKILFIIVIISITSSCIQFTSHPIIDSNIRIAFKKYYNITGLFNHFPNNVKNKIIGGMISYPPINLLPESRCNNQDAEIVIISNKSDYSKDLKKVFDKGVIYTTNYYSDSNFIIDITELKRTLFPVAKCNTYHKGEFPVPYFEDYNFGLGVKETLTKQLDGEPRPRRHTVYTIPEDLKVYVIGARAGNFWKFDCKENRPETLGKWKHGYSKGVAVSDKYDRVVFWVIVW